MSEKARLETIVGRLTFEKVFENAKTFGALHDAEAFCEGHGFSVGHTQREAPIGLKQGSFDIQKWRNLSFENKRELDGFIVGDDKRNGPVTVLLLEDPDA